jgi:hypothetical protein
VGNAAGELADGLHLLGLPQLRLQRLPMGLGLLAFGDVAQITHEDVAVGARRHADRQLHRELAAVGPHGMGFDQPPDVRPLAGAPEALHAIVVGAAVAWRDDQVGQRLAQCGIARMAEAAFGCGIELHHAAFAVHAHHTVEGGFDGGTQAGLALAQRLVGQLAFGDLPREGEDAGGARDRCALEHHLVPVQRTVLVAAMPFEAHGPAEPGALEVGPCGGLGIGFHAAAEIAGAQLQHLLAGVAIVAAGLGVDIDDAEVVEVMHEQGILAVLEDGSVAGLQGLLPLLGLQALVLGAGPDAEDAQQQFDQLFVEQRCAVHHHDQADGVAAGVFQGARRVGVETLGMEKCAGRELIMHAAGHVAGVAPHHVTTGRILKCVAEGAQGAAVQPGGQGHHVFGLVAIMHTDHRGVDACDGGEMPRDLAQRVRTLHAGDGQRGFGGARQGDGQALGFEIGLAAAAVAPLGRFGRRQGAVHGAASSLGCSQSRSPGRHLSRAITSGSPG